MRTIRSTRSWVWKTTMLPTPICVSGNADGGEVGACGNGTRAAAWLIFEDTSQSRLTLASKGGVLGARRLEGGTVEVDLGQPRLRWQEIPLARPMDTVQLDL